MANLKKPPCYNCDKRTMQCHATCEGYKDFQMEIEKRRKARADAINFETLSYKSEQREKAIRKRHEKAGHSIRRRK